MISSLSKNITGNLIAASAGTGKTYQLTSRFVALLALGAKPEKMIALTFTKKAAGEFRNRIFQALSDGALGKADFEQPQRNVMAARVWETWTGLHLNPDFTLSPSSNHVALYPAAIPMMKRAAALQCYPEQLTPASDEPALPQLTTEFFADLLIRVLSKTSDLQLSTLDSFFNRVVAADMHRAGLSSITPMNQLQQQRATRAALLAMLAESEKSSHHESALITLLTSIAEDKGGSLLELLESNINLYLNLYKEFPQDAPWGDMEAFNLPDCADAELLSDADIEAYQRQINDYTNDLSWGKKRNFVKRSLPSIADKIRKGAKLSDSFSAWLSGSADYIPEDAEEELKDNMLRSTIRELKEKCNRLFLRSVQERSKAMHSLLQKYYTAYRENILKEGLCSFDDIKQGARQLLGNSAGSEESGVALTLTTRLDHWMLDEFQDTDPVQWEILSNLLKENAQYPDKSLFVVGDKKQSIYSFRGASAELFEQLRGTKKTADGYDWQKHILTNSTLTESRRSVPEIMNFTNMVFASLSEVDTEFSEHRTHCNNHKKKGYVRVQVLPKDKSAQVLHEACHAVGDILDELTEATETHHRQLRNGISVAILVRKGSTAREIVAWLRRYKPEIPVQLVEDSPLTEASPLGELLLSFFMWLKEPADQYRYNVLRVSPLQGIMNAGDDNGINTQSAAWDYWRQRLNNRGYAQVIQELASYLPQNCPERMVNEWLEEAVIFDASGGDLDEWLLHMRTCCRKENGSSQYVQVMTMHKSKGAEFDAVILPFLGTKAVDQPRAEGIPYFISEDKSGILVHPGKSEERSNFPALVAYEEKWKRERRDDSYNLMYVAITRARYANYVLLPGGGEATENPNKEADWILEALLQNKHEPTLEHSVEFGHADWYAAIQKSTPQSVATPTIQTLGKALNTRNRISPSTATGADEALIPAEQRLSEDTTGADFGTAVHQCWEEISWLHEALPTWLEAPNSEEQKIVANALLQPQIKSLFTQHPGQEAYNEQSIEAITADDEWLSASIDRLILTHDSAGKVIAAHIIDFKTNKPGPRDGFSSFDEWLLSHYAPQMKGYGELIKSAFGLTPDAITRSLISCPKGHTAKVLTYPR